MSDRTPRPDAESDRPAARAAGGADEARTEVREPADAPTEVREVPGSSTEVRETADASPAGGSRASARAAAAADAGASTTGGDDATGSAATTGTDATTAGAAGGGTSAGGAPTPSFDELQARAAQTREEVRVADARRAEEATAQAEQAAEDARRAEREARERAQRATQEAERARAEAGLQTGGSVSGASVTAPGVGSTTEPKAVAEASAGSRAAVAADGGGPSTTDERPELLVGGVFVAAFLVGRILKRILD